MAWVSVALMLRNTAQRDHHRSVSHTSPPRRSPEASAAALPVAGTAAPPGNLPAQFPPEQFDLLAFCEACGHSATLERDRLPPGVTVQEIPPRLRCTACGQRPGTIRIVYAGAGGFAHSGTGMAGR